MDSTNIKGQWSYKLKFKPKEKSSNSFYGDFWVSMENHALLLVNMRMNPEANINLVNRIIIYQEYDLFFIISYSIYLTTSPKTLTDCRSFPMLTWTVFAFYPQVSFSPVASFHVSLRLLGFHLLVLR